MRRLSSILVSAMLVLALSVIPSDDWSGWLIGTAAEARAADRGEKGHGNAQSRERGERDKANARLVRHAAIRRRPGALGRRRAAAQRRHNVHGALTRQQGKRARSLWRGAGHGESYRALWRGTRQQREGPRAL